MDKANDKTAAADAWPIQRGLCPMPPQRVLDTHLPTGIKLYGYSAADMRTYAAQEMAAEREQWATLLSASRRIAEQNIKRADDCGTLSRALVDALKVLRA